MTHWYDLVTIRTATRGALESFLLRRLKPFEAPDWSASAVVFAPHPDDETLGCGGIASKKLAAGVELRFVFITDGAASHGGRVAPEVLRRRRRCEGIEAVRRLGGTIDQVTFLDFPDGRASDHIQEIAGAVAGLLGEWHPQSIFVVHSDEPSADHLAVHAGVLRGARTYGQPVTVYEYPVWYWYHWPWVPLASDLPGMWRKTLRQTIATAGGVRTLSRFNSRADVRDALDRKSSALAAHGSQTVRPADQADWPILSDLAGGEFLARLLGDYETFRRYELNASGLRDLGRTSGP